MECFARIGLKFNKQYTTFVKCSSTCVKHAAALSYHEHVPVQRLGIEPKMNARTVALIFGKFLYLFLASLILGLVLGLFSALLLKKYNVSQTPQVVLLTVLTCCRTAQPCEL